MKARWFGVSEQAGRDSNDDMFCAGDSGLPLYAVADGIGARPGAAVASRLAVSALARHVGALTTEERLDDRRLHEAVDAVNAEILAAGAADPGLTGLGTTLSAVILGTNEGRVIHVGDSRVYLLRDGCLSRLTHDHTVANDLVAMKRLPADAVASHPLRSMLSRFLGTSTDAEPEIQPLYLREGDCVMLATDGLTAALSEADILRCCNSELASGVEALCRCLASEAMARRPPDNVTVVAVQLLPRGAHA